MSDGTQQYYLQDIGAEGELREGQSITGVNTVNQQELQEYFSNSPMLQQTFGSFGNYEQFMSAQAEMFDSGELVKWWEVEDIAEENKTDEQKIADMLLGNPYMQNQDVMGNETVSQGLAAQWQNVNTSDAMQALLAEYGIGANSSESGWGATTQDAEGNSYQWTGTGWKLYKEAPEKGLIGQVVGVAAPAILSAGFGAGIAPAIAGGLGVTSATGLGAIQGATGATIGGAINGDIDPKSILIAAAMGGLNPGGTLSNQMGLNPNSFAGGFVGGGVNTLIGDGLRTGDIDLQSALTSGLIQGGMNSVTNFFENMNSNSPEALMASEAQKHEADYKRANGGDLTGYVPLTETQLFDLAMANPLVNKSNLGALVGEGGLLPFIPELPLEGLINLKELLLGHQDGTSLFLGPNGNYLTHAELIAAGQDPVAVFQATLGGGAGIDGYTHAGYANNPPGLVTKITDKITELVNQTPVGPAIGNMLDAAAAESFKNKYGFYAADDPTLAAQVVAYGPLEENYSYAANPRGDSEMFGTTYTNGNYTQGLQTLIDAATGTRSAITVTADQIAAVNEAGDAAREQQQQLLNNGYIINLNDEPLQTLPGAENNAFWEQFLASFNNNGAEEVASTVTDNATTLPGSEIPFEVGDEVEDEVDDSVDNPVDNNANVVVDDTNNQTQLPSNPDYRRNQIIEMLGSTIASLPEQLPPDSKTTLPGLDPISNPNNGVNPEWGDLYKYKRLEKWKKARDRQYAGIAGLLQQQGNPLNSTKRQYTQRQKSDMGLLS